MKTLIRMLATALAVAALLSLTTAHPGRARPAAATTPVLISGLDLHDSMVRKIGPTYYLYGTMYGCGYEWYDPAPPTPWCGFGVSTATALTGPWTPPVRLFDPASLDPWAQVTWQETCGGNKAQGCFNPRMLQRTGWGPDDGVFVLWFNAPRHYTDTGANAYNVMGCAGPLGPCGPGAVPNGSYNKPSLDICTGNGDFGIIESPQVPGRRPALACTLAGNTGISLQELNWWGSGGTLGSGVNKVAGLTKVESPGGWWDASSNQYVLTYADQGCGYCSGTPAGYATSPTLYSGWSAPGNVGWGAPVYARRDFSVNSCGGQPRTVSVLDGQPWQIIDLWLGTRNETDADTYLVPLAYTPVTGTPGDGQVWWPPLDLHC